MLDRQHNKTGLANYFCTFGDWNPVIKTPCHVTAAAAYIHDVMRMAEMADAIGESAQADSYRAQLNTLKAEYHTAFWNDKAGTYVLSPFWFDVRIFVERVVALGMCVICALCASDDHFYSEHLCTFSLAALVRI